MYKLIGIICFGVLLFSCDTKKVSVKGKVIDAGTKQGIVHMLVTMHQCKSNGDNCEDIVIGQCYTNTSGDFVIDQKTAKKSKTKWLTVYNNSKKLAEKDGISVTESGLVIEVNP